MFFPLVLVPVLASVTTPSTPSVPERSKLRCSKGFGFSARSHEPSLLELVNKSEETALDADWEPEDMVEISRQYMAPGSRGLLRAEAALALAQMLEAGKAEGHEIFVRSAFRSHERQGRIFQRKSHRYGEARASRVSARAGHSQHQLGTTIDIVLPRYRNRITQRIAKSPEYAWLRDHAHHYGFALSYPQGEEALTGYMYEPWHYRYLGVGAATEMWERQLPMERYLRACREHD